MQNHLSGYKQFRTTVEGIELVCLIDESTDDDGNPAYSCESVMVDGREINELLYIGEKLFGVLEKKYEQDQNELIQQAKLSRQLDALEDKQWNSSHS